MRDNLAVGRCFGVGEDLLRGGQRGGGEVGVGVGGGQVRVGELLRGVGLFLGQRRGV